jgi:hypothetical protein
MFALMNDSNASVQVSRVAFINVSLEAITSCAKPFRIVFVR